MKAADLMIGDWVQSFGEPHKIIGIRTDTPYPYIKTNMSNTWYEWGLKDLADGIPLTPEILAKNFQKDPDYIDTYWRPDCRKFCFVKENDDWYFAFRYKGGHICIAECNYVHELQHALRLCGIEKEIEL